MNERRHTVISVPFGRSEFLTLPLTCGSAEGRADEGPSTGVAEGARDDDGAREPERDL